MADGRVLCEDCDRDRSPAAREAIAREARRRSLAYLERDEGETFANLVAARALLRLAKWIEEQ